MKSAAKGTWFSYEVDAIKAFYERQTERKHPLTPLDRLILTESIALAPEQTITDMVINKTGLFYSNKTVTDHKNALVYGVTSNPRRSPQTH